MRWLILAAPVIAIPVFIRMGLYRAILRYLDAKALLTIFKAVRDLVGDNLAYRKKQMFTVPVGEWLREHLAPFTEAVLFDECTLQRNLFRPEKVRRKLDAHRDGSANYTCKTRALIVVELWARIFLDSDGRSAPTLSELGIDPALMQAGSVA